MDTKQRSIIYAVNSDLDDGVLYAEFETKDQAMEYAKQHLDKLPFVDELDVSYDANGEIDNVFSYTTIWDHSMVDDETTKSEEDDYWDMLIAEHEAEEDGKHVIGDTTWFESVDADELVETLEENETEVECKECFDIFPKTDCVKVAIGYICPTCAKCEVADEDTFKVDFPEYDKFPSENEMIPEEPVKASEEPSPLTKDFLDQVGNDLISGEPNSESMPETAETENDPISSPEEAVPFLVQDEEEAVVGYEKAAEVVADSDLKNKEEILDTIDHIKEEEIEHIEELTDLVDTETTEVENDLISDDSETEPVVEHINEEHPAIESDKELEGTDNAVVDCKVNKVIAHSEDEKPVDCKGEKKPLEKPLTEYVEPVESTEDIPYFSKAINGYILIHAGDFARIKQLDNEAVRIWNEANDADLIDGAEKEQEFCAKYDIDQCSGVELFDKLTTDAGVYWKVLEDSEDYIYLDVDESVENKKNPLTEGRTPAEIRAEIEKLQQELAQAEVEEKKASYGGKLPTQVWVWDIYLDPADKGTWTSAELYKGKWDGAVFETRDAAINAGRVHLGELAGEEELERDPDDYTIDAFAVPVADVDEYTLSFSDLDHLIEGTIKADKKSLTEETHAKYAQPEGDRKAAYNNALKYAKENNVPYIYGYTGNAGKFFAFAQPVKVTGDVLEKEQEFRSRYKNCKIVYIAYPTKAFVEDYQKFTPEEMEEYGIDEDGCSIDGYDEYVRCTWCENIFTKDDCNFEADLGWLCDRCYMAIASRGEKLTMIVNPTEEDIKRTLSEEVQMTAKELKDKYGTDDVDLINAGKESEERVELKEEAPEYDLTEVNKLIGELRDKHNKKSIDMR